MNVLAEIAKAQLNEGDVDLTGYATKDDIKDLASTSYVQEEIAKIEVPDVSKFITEIPEEYITAEELAAEGFLKEHQSLEEYAKTKTVVAQKYEVLPLDGMFVQYNDNEVRVNTQHVDINSLPAQNAGDGSSSSLYYATFRAYAPEGATSVIEGSKDVMDAEHSTLAVDSYGRKYTVIWAAIAQKKGDTWSKFGDSSTIDKYIGFFYNFHWYNEDKLISKEKVRVVLTNDACHNDLVPAEVNARINEKLANIEVPEVNLEGYATEQFVNEAIATIELPEAEIYKVDFNAPDFAAATEAYKAGKVLMLINAAPDTNSYAMMNYVSDSYITFTKFLTNRSETYGAFNTYYLHADNTWEVSKEVKISKVEANVEGEVVGQLTTIKINKEIYSIPSVEGFATEAFVNEAIAGIKVPEVSLEGYATEEFVKAEIAKIEIPEADLSDYALKSDIPDITGLASEAFVNEAIAGIEHPTVDLEGYAKKEDLEGLLKEIPDEYITEEELEAKGYITEHQDLSAYALKEEIPSTEGLATESYVQEEIGKITIPEVDLSGYYTKAETDAALNVKADEVPFTTSKFVQNAIGGFAVGDDVKGLTVAQIFAKLLELSDAAVEPEQPDVPTEPESIVDNIIMNRLAMYEVNENDELVEVPFVLSNYSEAESKLNDGQSRFYVVKNADGEVIENGYQHISTAKEPWYIVALPEELEVSANGNVQLQTWDPNQNKWTDSMYVLTSDYSEIVAEYDGVGIPAPEAPAGYKLWADLSTSDPGNKYRFIIKE